MVRGMGAGMQFLEILMKEIKEQKGHVEVIPFLTRPRFKENLQRVVKTMIECDWRIPASEMRNLSEKNYRRDFEVRKELIEEVRNLWWYSPLADLGIPYRIYDNTQTSDGPHIPQSLKGLLNGRTMEYPLVVGRDVVVDWGTNYDQPLKVGEKIDMDHVNYLALADCRHFDFDR